VNGHLINRIMYADDLVLISPSLSGLCQLQHICNECRKGRDTILRRVQL